MLKYFHHISLVVNIESLPFFLSLLSFSDPHFNTCHPINEPYQPFQHRNNTSWMEGEHHSHSHRVSTELVNITNVHKPHMLPVLFPTLNFLLTRQKVPNMLNLLHQKAVGIGQIGFVGAYIHIGVVLLAEMLDIRE
jgi:hypothetical protein